MVLNCISPDDEWCSAALMVFLILSKSVQWLLSLSLSKGSWKECIGWKLNRVRRDSFPPRCLCVRQSLTLPAIERRQGGLLVRDFTWMYPVLSSIAHQGLGDLTRPLGVPQFYPALPVGSCVTLDKPRFPYLSGKRFVISDLCASVTYLIIFLKLYSPPGKNSSKWIKGGLQICVWSSDREKAKQKENKSSWG